MVVDIKKDRFNETVLTFEYPKQIFKLMDKKVLTILHPKFLICPQRNLVIGQFFGRQKVITLSVLQSVLLRVRCISPTFLEVGIPNLICRYILGWQSVAYHFWVTVTFTLTSDLVFRIIFYGAYLLYYLRYESQIWCVNASWDGELSHAILGSL